MLWDVKQHSEKWNNVKTSKITFGDVKLCCKSREFLWEIEQHLQKWQNFPISTAVFEDTKELMQKWQYLGEWNNL